MEYLDNSLKSETFIRENKNDLFDDEKATKAAGGSKKRIRLP